MPETGKKADLMFVQHMLAVLKADGKMATIMPHGVLFRGGKEKEARKLFIKDGWLEAIIGLPAGLFYGTGIPACVLVMNKKDAANRKRSSSSTPTGNIARARTRTSFARKTSRRWSTSIVSGRTSKATPDSCRSSEIAAEDFNCNIRRYVDNAPPPEPHDVRAHLHGGVPVVEIDALKPFLEELSGIARASVRAASRKTTSTQTSHRP